MYDFICLVERYRLNDHRGTSCVGSLFIYKTHRRRIWDTASDMSLYQLGSLILEDSVHLSLFFCIRRDKIAHKTCSVPMGCEPSWRSSCGWRVCNSCWPFPAWHIGSTCSAPKHNYYCCIYMVLLGHHPNVISYIPITHQLDACRLLADTICVDVTIGLKTFPRSSGACPPSWHLESSRRSACSALHGKPCIRTSG